MRHGKIYRITDIREPATAAVVRRLAHRDNGYHIDDRYLIENYTAGNCGNERTAHSEHDQARS